MTQPRKDILTQTELKSLVSYDTNTGFFTWINNNRPHVVAGDIAGCLHSSGYIHIGILGKIYKAHRLAFLYMTGAFPKDFVDHMNDVKNDNKWDNLRTCTKSQNEACKSIGKSNPSGYKGVSWCKKDKKFRAFAKFNGKQISLGYYDCKHEAAKAYNRKSIELHGEFAFLNDIQRNY